MLEFNKEIPYEISHVYFIDFATMTTEQTGSLRVCSDSYNCPEAFNSLDRCSKRDDVWGFIACLFIWVSGGHPMYVRDDTWEESFLGWYEFSDPTYWFKVVEFGTVSKTQAMMFMHWFSALKNRFVDMPLPSDEEIEYLFDA